MTQEARRQQAVMNLQQMVLRRDCIYALHEPSRAIKNECLLLPQALIWLLGGAALAGTPPKRMVNVRIQKLLALK
jgi:hypothetical protein